MKIVVAADHGGFLLKETLLRSFAEEGQEIVDVGCFSADAVDYPDYAEKAVSMIIAGECQKGILICGTGIGMSIVANRHREIRAANCYDIYTAQMSREHNNANILCLGARVIEPNRAIDIVRIWLATDFCGGRHQRRIEKFSD